MKNRPMGAHKYHEPEKKESRRGGEKKVEKVMHEFKHGELHSGSKEGPKVKNRKQAVSIALSEERKAGKASHTKHRGKK